MYYSKLINGSSNLFEKRNLEKCLQFNIMRFLLRKFICRFMLKFSRLHFQVLPCGMTNKMLWEHNNYFQISEVANSEKNIEPSSTDMREPGLNNATVFKLLIIVTKVPN